MRDAAEDSQVEVILTRQFYIVNYKGKWQSSSSFFFFFTTQRIWEDTCPNDTTPSTEVHRVNSVSGDKT